MKHDHADEVIARWRVEMPQLPELPLQIAKRTARLCAMLDAQSISELSKLELTRAEYGVLATLRRVGAPYRLKPSDLTAAAVLSTGGTSNVIRRMEQAGYVRRHEDPQDGRSSWVELTARGVKIAELAVQNSVQAHAKLLSVVPDGKAEALNNLLRQVLVLLGDRAKPPSQL